ncbi:hypothetical protein AAGR22_06030 [Erwinia sp. HDF1-3R]|uniref:hypothetical protein n=1 Tax=Erwinia sp. HDF1-3R TaxID=3141543 RepID=UPI0031F501B0
MLHSGSGGQGCPLATGPSGLEPEPKAPGKAWREDARHPQGLSTDKAKIPACTTHRHPQGLSTGSADIRPMQHNCVWGWGFFHKYVIKVTHNNAASLNDIPLPQQE